MLSTKNRRPAWHPCMPLPETEKYPPLAIESADGCLIRLKNGQTLIDGISSWWCKSLGHQHPRLRAALHKQSHQFEQVIFANTTYDVIEQLSDELTDLMPHLGHVFYAGDGSCAVEAAMKMSLHSRLITNEPKRSRFITLKNAYHGETIGALSVSDCGPYKQAYAPVLFDPIVIDNLPYVSGQADPLWQDAKNHWEKTHASLSTQAKNITAVMIEPIVQGAAGMKIISADFLSHLATWAQSQGIHVIADEIMTGMGRTGTMLACEHAQIKPDFICLSKGLTSGWLPFSCVLTQANIYDLFYRCPPGKHFLHSHTYSGNALGAALALETLHIMRDESLCQRSQTMCATLEKLMQHIAHQTGALINVRHIGAIIAADLHPDLVKQNPSLAKQITRRAITLGALLRPLGHTIYWFPPLIMDSTLLQKLADITLQAILDNLNLTL